MFQLIFHRKRERFVGAKTGLKMRERNREKKRETKINIRCKRREIAESERGERK